MCAVNLYINELMCTVSLYINELMSAVHLYINELMGAVSLYINELMFSKYLGWFIFEHAANFAKLPVICNKLLIN